MERHRKLKSQCVRNSKALKHDSTQYQIERKETTGSHSSLSVSLSHTHQHTHIQNSRTTHAHTHDTIQIKYATYKIRLTRNNLKFQLPLGFFGCSFLWSGSLRCLLVTAVFFQRLSVAFILHWGIGGRITKRFPGLFTIFIKCVVSSFKQIQIRVTDRRVILFIHFSVLFSKISQ